MSARLSTPHLTRSTLYRAHVRCQRREYSGSIPTARVPRCLQSPINYSEQCLNIRTVQLCLHGLRVLIWDVCHFLIYCYKKKKENKKSPKRELVQGTFNFELLDCLPHCTILFSSGWNCKIILSHIPILTFSL